MRVQLLLPALIALATTAACMPTLESAEPPQRVYWLEPASNAGAADVNVHPRVTVVPGLDSDRILVLEPDRRLNHFAGAFWPDSLEPLLQSVLARALAAESRAPTVELDVVVERFFAVAAPAAAAPEVVLRARIEDRRSGRTCTFDGSARAATNRLRDIVAAHQETLDGLARALGRIAAAPDAVC